MSLQDQIPRNGVLWLLVAVVVCVAPLTPYLPFWVPLVVATALAWRVGIFRGRLGAPQRWLKALLVVASIAGLVASYGRLLGLGPMVAMLVCAFALKLLEMHTRRDALVVVFLAYFVAITLALFDPAILAALLIALAFIVVTASLVGLHRSEVDHRRSRPLKTGMLVLAQAFPLMVILFLVMPRIGPLWSVPSADTGITGMRDTLELGGISRLSQSSEIAFRVEFDGVIPPREQLYWRGLTLSRFNGEQWRRVLTGDYGGFVQWFGEDEAWWRENVDYQPDEPVRYRVMLEKTGAPWLYSLWAAEPLTVNTGLLRNMTLVADKPVYRRVEYRALSYPESTLERDGLSSHQRHINLQLPADSNPRTQRLAEEWREQAGAPRQLIDRLLNYYRANFTYTLTPADVGAQGIDDFLWQSREGFCEHFAASFVFFMRAAGIPARIVAGYLGGEVQPEQNYLTVRQYDAHAWAEVWLEGEGWVRVDPTAAVAPERIVSSLLDFMSEEVVLAQSPFDMARYRDIAWLNRLRIQLELIEYNWVRWVLDYEEIQVELLRRLLGGVEAYRLSAFVVAGSLVALLPLFFRFRRRPEQRTDPVDRAYVRFCEKLARAGCRRMPGEGPEAFAGRCVAQFPESAPIIKSLTESYIRLKYGRGGDPARFIEQVGRFRLPTQKRPEKTA